MNKKNRIIGALVSAGTTLTMVVGLGVGVANADPVATPTVRTLAISGSDTIDEVFQSLAESPTALAIGGVRQVENWSALGGGNVTPHGSPTGPTATNGCQHSADIPRPNGSGAGRTALLNSIGPGATTPGCFQLGRSSSLSLGAVPAGKELVYIPFARESVSFAVSNTSNILRDQTFNRIKQFYECKNSSGTVLANPATKAMLPQSNSGHRRSWLFMLFNNELATSSNSTLGANITSNTTTGQTSAGCVQNGADEFGVPIQEHQGGQVNDSEMVPYSAAQWMSQAAGVAPEFRGKTTLGQINSTNPFNSSAFLQRSVYVTMPTAFLPTSNTSPEATAARTLFVGASAQICSSSTGAQAIIQRFGLYADPNCGDTTQQTPGS